MKGMVIIFEFSDLTSLKITAIADVSKDSLVDLRDINIDTAKPVSERMIDYFEQIRNPYLFKVGDMKVKVCFGTNRKLTDALQLAVKNSRNYQTNLG